MGKAQRKPIKSNLAELKFETQDSRAKSWQCAGECKQQRRKKGAEQNVWLHSSVGMCVACNVDVLKTCMIRHSLGKGYYLDIIGGLLYVS